MSELQKLCERLNIRIEAKFGAAEVPEGWSRGTTGWRVTLKKGRRRLTTNFFTGPACGEPTAADVLSCLCSDARAGELSFYDFCGEFGLDEDSRKAKATHRACEKMAPRIRRFLGEAFEAVSSAEH